MARKRKSVSVKFITAADLEEEEKNIDKLPTLVKAIDDLFGGGIPLRRVIEFAGPFASYKTQFGLQLVVMAQVKWPESYQIIIDTEKSVTAERLKQIGEAVKKKIPELKDFKVDLSKIVLFMPNSTDELISIIDNLEKEVGKDIFEKTKVIVIDSIAALFREEYQGRGQLSERQQKLAKVAWNFKNLVYNNMKIGYITNQVYEAPDVATMTRRKIEEYYTHIPWGGHVLAHVADYRFLIRRYKGTIKEVILIDATDKPLTRFYITMSENGLVESVAI